MKVVTYTFAALLIGTSLFTSCKKYPDGPGFSLLGRKERMEGKWDLQQTDHSDGSVTYDNTEDILEMTEDEKCYLHSGYVTVEGEWYFADKKQKVHIKIGNVGQTFSIRRLKNKELWIMDDSTQDVYKYKNTEKDD